MLIQPSNDPEENLKDKHSETSNPCKPNLYEPLSPRSSRICKNLMRLNNCGEREAREALASIKGFHGSDGIDGLDDSPVSGRSIISNEETAERMAGDQRPHQ